MTKKISVRQYVDIERVYHLLVSALEGGSNYWYMIQGTIHPQLPHSFEDEIWKEKREKDPNYVNQCEIPFNKGGALFINDECADDPILKKLVCLDLKRIKRGLVIMAKKFPKHYADFLNENDDSITADVFLQCCIFGEVIYG